MTPLRFANPSPSSGWIEDFHLQAVVHTRHTARGPLRKKMQAAVTTGLAENARPSLRDGLTNYTRSPWGSAVLPPITRRPLISNAHTLDLSTGRPGPRDFTVRRRSFVGTANHAATPKRPSHPTPDVRDDRDTSPPTQRNGMDHNADLAKPPKDLFLSEGLDGVCNGRADLPDGRVKPSAPLGGTKARGLRWRCTDRRRARVSLTGQVLMMRCRGPTGLLRGA